MTKIFITSTLPYANSYRPHIGHLFEFILSDSITRYYKSFHKDVIFNTGLDQNGSKILQKAEELNIPIKDFLSDVSKEWKKFCELFHIEYDHFYETSSEEHSAKVIETWNYLLKTGDLYEKEYTGIYCVGCESFKLNKDLVNDKCPDHPNVELQEVNEVNYFFNLGKYKNNIVEWLNSKPINPENKVKELLVFINSYDEISVSRKKTNQSLGIDVPGREDQVIYVWFDALLNYIYAANKFGDWNKFDKIIQLCGPDNLRFQAQIFQCFLSALGYKNTDTVFIHGTILDKDGKKMSKTLGNVIDPFDQLEKYGLDAVRYYTLAGLNTTDNSNWDETILVNQFNSEVCNDFGNLVSRVLHLIDTKLNGELIDISTLEIKALINPIILINEYEGNILHLLDDLRIKEALQLTNELVKFGNKYINDEKPWSNENYGETLSILYYLLQKIAPFYNIVFPYKNIQALIEDKKKVILFTKLKLDSVVI